MSSKKNTRLTIAAFIFVAFFLPVFVVISAKSQFGLDEMMGPELDAGFITTWPETVDGMLKLAQVNRNDLVYDLGCGDGRIVIAAAKNYGARGVGIDLNPKRIEEANANAKAAEVENLVRFETRQFLQGGFFRRYSRSAIPPTNNQLRITSHSVETAENRLTRRIE